MRPLHPPLNALMVGSFSEVGRRYSDHPIVGGVGRPLFGAKRLPVIYVIITWMATPAASPGGLCLQCVYCVPVFACSSVNTCPGEKDMGCRWATTGIRTILCAADDRVVLQARDRTILVTIQRSSFATRFPPTRIAEV